MQEEGWPLGLQPLNARIGLVRNRDFSGSVSFSTLLTASPSSSSISSSDLDTEVSLFFSLIQRFSLSFIIRTTNLKPTGLYEQMPDFSFSV